MNRNRFSIGRMLLAKHIIAVAKEAHVIRDIYGNRQEPLKKHPLLVKYDKRKERFAAEVMMDISSGSDTELEVDDQKLMLLAEAASISCKSISLAEAASISCKSSSCKSSRKRTRTRTFSVLEGRDGDEFFGIDSNGDRIRCPVDDYQNHVDEQTRYVIEDVKCVASTMKPNKEPECWVTYAGFPNPERQPFTNELQYIQKQLS